MQAMKRLRPALSQLESKLERMIEGTFAQLFGRSPYPHDLVVQLSRAVETGLHPADDLDQRPIAPDQYIVVLNDRVHRQLLTDHPQLVSVLRQHIIDLVALAGYRLVHPPSVQLRADPAQLSGEFKVLTDHAASPFSTSALQPVRLEPASAAPPGRTYLLINGERTEVLDRPVISIGRASTNDICIDDPYMSRQHAQLRLRGKSYFIFDINSQSGVRVNDVPVKEHLLHNGDVVQMGKTHLVFLQDRPDDLQSTSAFEPVDE